MLWILQKIRRFLTCCNRSSSGGQPSQMGVCVARLDNQQIVTADKFDIFVKVGDIKALRNQRGARRSKISVCINSELVRIAAAFDRINFGGMSSAEVLLLRNTWERLHSGSPDLGCEIITKVFSRRPAIMASFGLGAIPLAEVRNKKSIRLHAKKYCNFFTDLITNLHDIAKCLDVLCVTAVRHVAMPSNVREAISNDDWHVFTETTLAVIVKNLVSGDHFFNAAEMKQILKIWDEFLKEVTRKLKMYYWSAMVRTNSIRESLQSGPLSFEVQEEEGSSCKAATENVVSV